MPHTMLRMTDTNLMISDRFHPVKLSYDYTYDYTCDYITITPYSAKKYTILNASGIII